MSKKYIILLAVGLLVIGLDQWSKMMAVQYLRHPGSHCYDKRRACERGCREGLARNQGSLVSCNKRCSFKERACQKEQNLVLSRWNFDLQSMKESLVCHKVSQPWSGSNPECIVIPGFFHFRYQTNSGAAWGLFSDYPPAFRRPFFITITILAILFIIYLFSFRIETEHRQMVFALSLILGGALGNFLDRLRLDYVVDFIYWYLRMGGRSHSWPTFNVADVAISVGVFLIAIEVIRSSFIYEEEEEDEDGESPAPAKKSSEVPVSSAETAAPQVTEAAAPQSTEAQAFSEEVVSSEAATPAEASTDAAISAPVEAVPAQVEAPQEAKAPSEESAPVVAIEASKTEDAPAAEEKKAEGAEESEKNTSEGQDTK
ncbi:MAG: signal peptidase II [Myxococcales bacterium]|nr:signal peptidase II [Myxococcales bacterium]MCB9643348.1 signal peptidase II [Myxococcales bacterium]